MSLIVFSYIWNVYFKLHLLYIIILLHWQYYQNFIISNTNFYCLFGRFFFLLSILRPFFTDLLPLLFWKKVENLIELVWGGCLPKQESRYCISTKGTRLVNFIVLLYHILLWFNKRSQMKMFHILFHKVALKYNVR